MALFGLMLPLWAWQLIIAVLRATGAINLAESLSLKVIAYLADKLKNAKTYHENSDFPQPPPGQTNEHKFTVGKHPSTE